MTKWADFVITEVKYNSDHTHIDEVKVYEYVKDDTKLGNQQTQNRDLVIQSIRNSSTYVTATTKDKNKPKTFNKGADVEVIPIDDKEYIKTENNNTAKII